MHKRVQGAERVILGCTGTRECAQPKGQLRPCEPTSAQVSATRRHKGNGARQEGKWAGRAPCLTQIRTLLGATPASLFGQLRRASGLKPGLAGSTGGGGTGDWVNLQTLSQPRSGLYKSEGLRFRSVSRRELPRAGGPMGRTGGPWAQQPPGSRASAALALTPAPMPVSGCRS